MIRRLALVAFVLTALAWCASPAAAAERPGAAIWTQQGFFGSTFGGIAATPNGGFVAAGKANGVAYTPQDTWVRAFQPDGSPDPNFGDGGTVTFTDDRRSVADAFVQPDGRILIVESGPALVRRLTPTGQPDPSFGTDGQAEPGVETGDYAVLTSVALQPDGRLVLAWTRGDDSIVVSRLLVDGSPDTGFGSGGQAVISPGADTGPQVELQPDGGIVLVASRGGRIVIGRLKSDGAPDASFGGGTGLTALQFPRPELTARLNGFPGPFVVPGGRIRIAVAFTPRGRRVERSSLVGLTASGQPDRRFGDHGLAVGGPALRTAEDFGHGYLGGEAPSRLVLDERGGMLMVSRMATSPDDLAAEARTTIRRFRADGTLDRSFGRNGGVRLKGTYAPYTAIDYASGLVGDRLIVGEHNWDAKYQTSHSARLTAIHAGYDTRGPTISIKPGCRWVRVRVHEEVGLARVVVRIGRRVVRRTTRKPQRFRVRPGMRVSVVAVDLAGNATRLGTTAPPC